MSAAGAAWRDTPGRQTANGERGTENEERGGLVIVTDLYFVWISW